MSAVREAIRRATPPALREWYHRGRLLQEARRLARAGASAADPRALCDLALASRWFQPLQERSELRRFLSLVPPHPRAVCEIGVAAGGTSFVLTGMAASDAIVVLVELAFPPGRERALRAFGRARQSVVCVGGDSHTDEIRARVERALDARPLDVLFIDGDHRYEGVRADFERYTPLVRHGGIVAFHDIVPDARTVRGVDTGTHTGGVPVFWREIRGEFRETWEVIARQDQDGGGIGVLRWEAQDGRTDGRADRRSEAFANHPPSVRLPAGPPVSK
jgi:predicted O-methyltransferase YrrM